MRKEEELIYLVSRVKLDEKETSLIENLLKEDLDWNYILKRLKLVGNFIVYKNDGSIYLPFFF